MAGSLQGRVAIVTGAGRGLGRAYALQLAGQGAAVVVNDLWDGSAEDAAGEVVAEIAASGGSAIADHSNIASFDDARSLVRRAVDEFGKLDVVVNNAGNLRDRMLVNMSESDWDDVISVHLKGHFSLTRHAAAFWKERAAGGPQDAVLVQTTSVSGLHGNIGQSSYAVAKAGIAMFAHLNHLELNQRYGVRVYAVAPGARTRMTTSVPAVAEQLREPEDGSFDYYNPANVAAVVGWLAAEGCQARSGSVYGVQGDIVRRYDSWQIAATVSNSGQRWTPEALNDAAPRLNAGADKAFLEMAEGLARQ